MTHRERLLKVARGEWADCIPWMPRIDLWHNANKLSGTLPKRHQGKTVEEIHRSEGWPLHKVIPEYLKPENPEDIIHRGIGLYRLKEFPYDFEFSADVEIKVDYPQAKDEYMTRVEYNTPVGKVSVQHGYTEQMKKAGASITWVKEHAIKSPADYKVLAYLFGHLKLKPAYERFLSWKESVGEDGIAVAQGMGIACSSPMHFIQKTLIGATEFYLHYNDFPNEMRELAEALETPYNQLLAILSQAPVDAVLWSANVDDMVTYPAYFEKDILPWCRKAADRLHEQGILAIMHPDGENRGLMDLIPACKMDIADAVTPYPMTKVKIEEYYDRWCRTDRLTIQGGIPEMLLLKESSSWEDLKSYMNHFFEAVFPGKRLIASIGDTSPPNTEFERLLYIGECFAEKGRLPMRAGATDPMSAERLERAKQRVTPGEPEAVDIVAKVMSDLMQKLIPYADTLSELFRDLAESFARIAQARQKEADAPLSSLQAMPEEQPAEASDPYAVIREDVLKGDHETLKRDVQVLLERDFRASDILHQGMLAAMETIGERFKDGSVYIPEVLLSARAMNEALSVLEPYLAAGPRKANGRIIIGTVRGDLHDIGKNMVISMLRGVGFEVEDLGVNVATDDFLKKVAEFKPDLLGMSSLLTTTMPEMKRVIQAMTKQGMRDQVKIMVGGAPVNARFAKDIGADGYAADAGEAIDLAKKLIAG